MLICLGTSDAGLIVPPRTVPWPLSRTAGSGAGSGVRLRAAVTSEGDRQCRWCLSRYHDKHLRAPRQSRQAAAPRSHAGQHVRLEGCRSANRGYRYRLHKAAHRESGRRCQPLKLIEDRNSPAVFSLYSRRMPTYSDSYRHS